MNLVERLKAPMPRHLFFPIADALCMEAAAEITRLQKERDGIDEERRTALALVLERNAQIQALQKELETAREDALEEAAKVCADGNRLGPWQNTNAGLHFAAAIRNLKDKETSR